MATERGYAEPPDCRITEALIEAVEDAGIERFAEVGVRAALEGDFRYWAYIFDRVDGRPTAVEVPEDDEWPEPDW